MRLHILSDTHMELGGRECLLGQLKRTTPEWLILAGDIAHCIDDVGEIVEIVRPDRYLWLRGNHEYYGHQPPEGSYSTFMTDEFVAATMWFPQDTHPEARKWVNDFKYVTPDWCFKINKKHMEFLHEHRRELIITHHLPDNRCVHPQYVRSLVNQYFVSPMALSELRPSTWIHGHTHCSHDMILDKTRIICNPWGYPGEKTGCDPNFMIEYRGA